MTGRNIGHYEILTEIGSGGMATVYAGRHRHLGNPVAIKILDHKYSQDPNVRQRFVDEARIQANIKHRNIVGVQDILVDEQDTVIVMEYLDGVELTDYLSRARPLSFSQVMAIALPIADALATAHGAGVVHRDIKPGNIFLVLERGEVVPKLMDFGIAKLTDETIRSQQTAAGSIMGTPQFMAPEQFEDSSKVDLRADVYAFGVMLHLMVSGVLPFDGKTVGEIMKKVLVEPPPVLVDLRKDTPQELARLVLGCLEKRVESRIGSMEQVVEVLTRLSTEIPPGELRPELVASTQDRKAIKELVGLASTTARKLAEERAAAQESRVEPRVEVPAEVWEQTADAPVPTAIKPASRGGWMVKLGIGLGVLVLVGAGIFFSGILEDSPEPVSTGTPEAEVTEKPAGDRHAVLGPAQPLQADRRPLEQSRVRNMEVWPDFPVVKGTRTGAPLRSKPENDMSRYLSAALAWLWSGNTLKNLESGQILPFQVTGESLKSWLGNNTAKGPGRAVKAWLEDASLPFPKGLTLELMEELVARLGRGDTMAYVGFQSGFLCEKHRYESQGDLAGVGSVMTEMLQRHNLTQDDFLRLKQAHGDDPLVLAEIAVRTLACISK